MAKQETVERWAAEAGVSMDKVKYDGGTPVVWRACFRCGGTGVFQGYGAGGVWTGVCFKCGGGKGSWVGLQGMAARERGRERKQERAVADARARARAAAAVAREFLAEHPGLAAALKAGRQLAIIQSFSNQLARKGYLSVKQVETALRIAREAAAPKPAQAEVPEGRQVVAGEVVSVKEMDDYYSHSGVTYKMLVKVEMDGGEFRVYGTVPRAIVEDVRTGSQVVFTATLKPKEAGFGFFSRPTGATVVCPE